MSDLAKAEEVLDFWLAAGYAAWFTKDEAFDRRCRDGFLGVYEDAAAGRLAAWEETPVGALALVLLLDQFPRNMFRGTPRAFATDPLAREVADRAIARGFDESVAPDLRIFFYLPFEHSEDLADQERSVALHEQAGLTEQMSYAIDHRDIIARFGRFPHRNRILGRETTADEQAFLDGGGFAG